jgi:hypothetical protein
MLCWQLTSTRWLSNRRCSRSARRCSRSRYVERPGRGLIPRSLLPCRPATLVTFAGIVRRQLISVGNTRCIIPEAAEAEPGNPVTPSSSSLLRSDWRGRFGSFWSAPLARRRLPRISTTWCRASNYVSGRKHRQARSCNTGSRAVTPKPALLVTSATFAQIHTHRLEPTLSPHRTRHKHRDQERTRRPKLDASFAIGQCAGL